ncbi:hypothetical protein ACLHDG_11195 [Sulfurovum sp. CS9]|uniref:hypothetical protein n=1 Tax=Sulfurovum sp. CS9 TaxID=3391146 RepID=UPI0039ECA508
MEKKQLANHWNYFLLLEKDFINLKNYIEVSERNFETYSFELSKILQLACSEIDSVCRLLCKTIDSTSDYFDETVFSGNISQYKDIILSKYPKLTQSEVIILDLDIDIKPWEEWDVKDSPNWWKSYNLVKHYRHSNFEKANLENIIYALSALMILNLYLNRVSGSDKSSLQDLQPKYFESKYFSLYIVTDPRNELPDFEEN